MDYSNFKFRMAFGQRIISFIFFLFIGLVLAGFLVLLLSKAIKDPTAVMRISAVMQDLLAFTLPAIAVAIFTTRQPATFLAVDKKIKLSGIFGCMIVLIVSIPAMNWIIAWNESISLPESLSSFEQWMKASENQARENISVLLGGTDFSDLIMSILIVGIMTGFAEEILFRGALLRLIETSGKNTRTHLAIWITAFVFSAIHLQFYGFIPRMLLGALFGYLLAWSGSIWLPIIAHAFNNSVTVIFSWAYEKGLINYDPNLIGTGNDITGSSIAIASAIFTIMGIYLLRKHLCSNQISCDEKQTHDQDISL